jgi:CheY-like chemotaxis protein
MKKVLIVEDDQIVANIYRNKFAVDGFEVEVAPDGYAGLEMAHQFRPDAIILDLMLPRMSGVDFMKQIRAHPDFRQLPVIVFSNTYLSNMVQEAWKAGATKCLSKANCTPKQVIEVVRSTLFNNGAPVSAPPPLVEFKPPHQTKPAPRLPAPSSHVPARAPERSAEAEAQVQAQVRKDFLDSFSAALTASRAALQGIIKADGDQTRLRNAQELYRRIHTLTGGAALAGLKQLSQVADALEALLKELCEKPASMNASSLRTVAFALDFLGVLFEHRIFPSQHEARPANILVVDDEALSRRAVTHALDRAKLKSVSVDDPMAAYELLAHRKFDLIFLDVDMPGMSGFELCAKLRLLPSYQKTPVVFVTSLTDFESRANSTMSGGNDLIAKPFLFLELAVKALVYVLRARLNGAK